MPFVLSAAGDVMSVDGGANFSSVIICDRQDHNGAYLLSAAVTFLCICLWLPKKTAVTAAVLCGCGLAW